MARPLRLSFENAVYHVMTRGNRKDAIFLSARDKDVFVDKMNETFAKYSFVCFAFCLVKNHYHLLIKTPFANISEGMHYLNASYANWFKAKHDIVGVVFQGRYKSIIVDEDTYALALSVYIHSNPPAKKYLGKLEEYKWSSYPDYMGIREPIVENLDTSLILSKFDNDYQKAMRKYRKYVLDYTGKQNPLKDVHKGCVLGSEDFIAKIEQRIRLYGEKREVPQTKSLGLVSAEDVLNAITSSLSITRQEIFEKKRGNMIRLMALFLMKKNAGLSLNQIGDLFKMDYGAVAMATRRFEKRLKNDNLALSRVEKVLSVLRNVKC
jgi:REP element-mobilizing transposase RayT